ncbi:MAG: DUF1015 domain-containing protein [Candidatus Brocadiaceae bacterium]|nr:DUF1015 domain-containing protein [Candidatus Brocadiaceae bacterium]
MAIIKPFQGLRYNQDIIKDMSAVVTPPYDVISPQEQEQYYQTHPNNIIRMDLGKELPGDTEKANKYTRASEFFNDWKRTGVIKQEDAPAVYIYDQEYSFQNKRFVRRGFIALVKLEPFDKGFIYPHEQTLPGPKADRLKLIQSCKANLSSIFALFPDEDSGIDDYLSVITPAEPEVDFIDDNGVRNVVWVITEREPIEKLVSLMRTKPLFIADGHHRYETSLVYKDQFRKESGMVGEEIPSDYVMMVCVSMNNPGLQILPFHRLIQLGKDYDSDHVLCSLRESFDVELLGTGGSLDMSLSRLDDQKKGHSFLMYVGSEDACYLLRLKSEGLLESVFANDHPEWKRLDAGILHGIVLKKLLGVGSQDVILMKNSVKYEKNIAAAVSLVRSGQYQLAFLLKPTRIEQVREIAMARKVMPPKSTNFYPKLITGIVINSFE